LGSVETHFCHISTLLILLMLVSVARLRCSRKTTGILSFQLQLLLSSLL
jgi:hypothetical protein